MTILKIVFACYLSFFASILFSQKEIPLHEKKKAKMFPSETFYLNRSYPDASIDLKAYRNAMQKAQAQDIARNGAAAGFDLPWTQEGPSNIGSRINTIAIHPSNPDIIFIGFATGGLFKTINGGANWQPVFDQQTTMSIGEVAFSPSNPNIMYVGTGDPNVTGYPFVGNGVYKSVDAGNTWQYTGLSEVAIISKVIVHPTNPDIVYVGAMGLPFERNEHRGFYKTINGGLSWTKTLFVSNQTGVIDIAVNPQNPNQLYAATWDRIRNNKETITNGTNGKIYKSNDGGTNWTASTNGLPAGNNGRIGLAYSPSNVNTVLAMYTDENEALKGIYKTTTGGSSWANTTTNQNFAQQVFGGMGWYFGKIYLTNNAIYVLGVDLWKSVDNGITWENISEGTDAHVDMHGLVVRGNALYLATDGGGYKSTDQAATWKKMEATATTQFYKVNTTPHAKGVYYAGAQDNGTVAGNKSIADNWRLVQRGDGFHTDFVPSNGKIIYTENQLGNIWMSKDSGSTFQLASYGIQSFDNRAWDTPYFVSKRQENNMFFATSRVYKNQSHNNPTWNVVSTDLTAGNIFGPQFHVVTCLEESKQDSNKLYAGTSDGRLWTNNAPTAPTVWTRIDIGLPVRYVTSVQNSPTNPSTLYVTHSGYKDNVATPLIHKSKNEGSNWTPINGNLPLLAINDLVVLPNHADSILFVASDGGVYGTVDAGIFWQRLGKNMPYLPIYDIDFDEKNNVIVAATHGRSIMTYAIDSLLYKAPPTYTLSGNIATFFGKNIKNVRVQAQIGTRKLQTLTDSLGNFSFKNQIVKGEKVTITPIKKDNAGNGLTTGDIVEIQKVVLGIKNFIYPSTAIAADANLSGTVTTADIIAIRKIILGITDTFPHGKSWRFYSKSHLFPTPNMPFNSAFPESITINSMDSNRTNVQFIAVKLGDINESAKPDLAPPSRPKTEAIKEEKE